MNTDGFALLLPNGAPDGEGNRSWNPTDGTFTEKTGKTDKASQDDVAYLTELVAEARKLRDFGPVYLFGYSNGGFMAYHMACKGLPGLRAVASLSGTSYVDDSTCDGAPPVSVLHIHGTEDSVILFDGDESEPDPKSNGEQAFYAGAHDMVTRWSQRAGRAMARRPRSHTQPLTSTTTFPAPRPRPTACESQLRRRNHHRTLDIRRQQPRPRLRRRFHRRSLGLAAVTRVATASAFHIVNSLKGDYW